MTRAAKRREQAIIRAATQWFNGLRPSGWLQEKHVHAPACNTTTDEAEKLARAVAARLRHDKGPKP